MRNRIIATILSVAIIAAIATFIIGGTHNTSTQAANAHAARMNGPVRQDGQPPSGDSDGRAQVFPEDSYLPEGQVFVGTSVQNDVSPALRDIPLIEPVPFTEVRTMEEYLGREEDEGEMGEFEEREQIEDPVLQSDFFGSAENSVFAMPGPLANFEGVNNRDGVSPPDTNMDVGPNHIVQWVNLSFQIFDKSGRSLYGPTEGNTLWSGFGGQCENNNHGDPIVLYDPLADRWLMSQLVASSPYGECIAISATGDPTGSYYRYFFQLSGSALYDYPHLGVWPDGYYMAANRFSSSALGAGAIVFDRAKMLNGQTATYQEFNVRPSYGTLLPADLDGATLPPSGEPNFFASVTTAGIRLWKFKVNWTTPSSSTFTGPTLLSIAAYNTLCSGTRSCVPQPGTSTKVDGMGDRLMHRLVYRNFGTHEALALSHAVNAASSGTRAGVRWYEIRNPNGTPSIYQQGTYSPDTNHRWMSSLAFDKQGNMAMGYSVSSSSVYPSIRYTGRLSTDTLGQMPQGEVTLISGTGSQTNTGRRWGDYAMMAVDPVDDCTFWFTTEYMATTGPSPWQTRIGSFKFPSCGGLVDPTPPIPTPTISSPCPNQAGGYCRRDNEARTWIAGTTNLSITGDDQTKSVSLPFSFTFAGATYTTINVSSNGNAHFGSASDAFTNLTIPSSAAPDALIAALWDDLSPYQGGAIYTGVSGTAPNRTFIIEWRDVHRYGAGNSGATFEIQLVEGSNHIWILFQDTIFGNSSYDSGLSATCGVENAAGTAGNLYSYNTALLTNNKVIHFWPQP